ncbi:P1 protein [Triticum yellow stripe virus]|uniref:P1 protein n=1 Tax=Triticum yellow stripe virus TaxID=3035804 RepID=A0AA95J3X1_9VIRU|nr:P1 protein [Triticum yellow stripe virus]
MSNFSTFLWLSWFLSCFPAGLTYGTTTSNSPLLYSNLPWSGVYPLDTPQKSLIYSTAPQLDASQWTCPPCVQELNMPTTYGDFVQLLSAKINADSKRAALTAWNAFADLSVLVFSRLSATSHRCFGALLWFVALVWSQVLLTGFRTAVYVFTTYYLPVSYLCLLGIITRWTYMGLMWGFGTLPALVCLTALKSILRILTFKRCFNEKTVAGYDSYSVPQTPPKRSVIMMRRPNKEHIGYANCIRLFTGENALATVDHNLEEGCEFYSPRTGNAIPVTQFRVVFQSNKMDVVILVGPSNWEALLGCKGVHFTTAQRLAKSPAALYLLNADGEWRSHSAKIVGHFDNFAQVLSNTKVGHSGAGYFYGKTLVGLHKGHPGSDFNFNLMAPLPGIPGLTSPQYIVESPPPQGLIFPEDVVDVIETTIKEARSYLDTFRHSDEIHSSRKQWKSGIAWADLEDESGNEKAAASASTNAQQLVDDKRTPAVVSSPPETVAPSSPRERQPPTASPHTSTTSTTTPVCPVAIATSPDMVVPTGPSQQDIMNNIMSLLVQRIDMSKIERAIIDQVSQQALKKPRGKRGSQKKRAPTKDSSTTSTPGKYKHPNQRSQGSDVLAPSPQNTTPAPAGKRHGGGNSVPNTLSWVRKLPASGGPKSGPPPS